MSQEQNPWQHEQSQQGHAANYYQSPQGPPPPQQQQAQQQAQGQNFGPPRRTQTEQGLPQGQERSEQLETMQNYEARAPQSEDDKNQATLQKEFPNIDSSLIAAIYSDNKNVAETREMLQELGSS
jgi:hypothetical protein